MHKCVKKNVIFTHSRTLLSLKNSEVNLVICSKVGEAGGDTERQVLNHFMPCEI